MASIMISEMMREITLTAYFATLNFPAGIGIVIARMLQWLIISLVIAILSSERILSNLFLKTADQVSMLNKIGMGTRKRRQRVKCKELRLARLDKRGNNRGVC